MARRIFRIHGDNIVECERVLGLIRVAYAPEFQCVGPIGVPTTPRFVLSNGTDDLEFVLFPGFGRWDEDVLRFVKRVAGTLREAADCIVTSVDGNQEHVLIAIEYCSALDAGNNAWQRCGRAYSFAKAGIPYFYLTDIGGYELGSNRSQKSRRYPNPAVPFAFVALSLRSGVCALPVYTCNPSADNEFRKHFAPVFDEASLSGLLFAVLQGQSTKEIEDDLREKAILFSELIQTRPDKATASRPDFSPKAAYEALLKGQDLVDYMRVGNIFPWRKSVSIPVTATARNFLHLGSQHGAGVSRSALPLCVVFSNQRKAFARAVQRLYPDLPPEVAKWLDEERDIVLCYVAGFKPRGDDSRPDRGLVPLARMLFGDEIDVLSFVYGPGKPEMWRLLHNDPQGLIEKNGLWEAVCRLSDCILVDAPTNKQETARAYLRLHWTSEQKRSDVDIYTVREIPEKYGENDVDTVLHNIFAYLMEATVFEGMCNPPGGDWSGISVLDAGRTVESRWLTLPRVSGTATKRPDHVFQVWLPAAVVVVAVESKETPKSMEPGIGPRLRKYIETLFMTPPNAQRHVPDGQWAPYSGPKITMGMDIATAVAFMSSLDEDVRSVMSSSQSDLSLAVDFTSAGQICQIRGKAASSVGQKVLSAIRDAVRGALTPYRWVD